MKTGERRPRVFFGQFGLVPWMVIGIGLLLRFVFVQFTDAPQVAITGTVLVVVGGVWGLVRWARAA